MTTKKNKGSLAAIFLVIEGGTPKFKVVTSNNFGEDWGDPIVAWDIVLTITGTTFANLPGCPELEETSLPGSGVLSLLTTITDAGGTFAWIVTSLDSGLTWGDPVKLGEVPADCDD